MEKTIFTEDQMYTLIDIWYKGDDLFKLVARGLVKLYIAEGKDLDDDLIYDLMNKRIFWSGEVEG